VIAGSRLGKYEIVSLLSVGGMAEVYLACITGPGGFRKFVGLKRILPDLREDEQFVELFMNEARVSAGLSHANIAQVFDFGEEGEHLFLAMEFVHGVDLLKVIKQAVKRRVVVPPGLAAKVIRDLCLALNYAHTFVDPSGDSRPVIHRDVTPRNVMLSHAGQVKVIDFGIAKVSGTTAVRTDANVIRGSAGYMAPEHLMGEPLDGRADLFCAGVLLYELLTGTRLFASKDLAEATRRILQQKVQPPHELVEGLSPALSAVALRALRREPAERFATGREMARALEDSVRGELFDEDAVGAWVREHFPEQLTQTRRLLESLARREDDAMRVIANTMREAEEHSSARADAGEPPTRTLETSPWAAPKATDLTRGASILAVDDSKVGQKAVSLRLGAEGFNVMSCGSAEEALQALDEMRPDLVITDVRMPGMDGFTLCEKIRERKELQSLPIIFLSAACSVEERARGLAVGGDDFIRKPFEPADLVARVRGHLQRVAVLRSAS